MKVKKVRLNISQEEDVPQDCCSSNLRLCTRSERFVSHFQVALKKRKYISESRLSHFKCEILTNSM